MDFGSFKLTWSLTPMSLTKTVPLSYNSGKSSVKFFHWFSLSYSRFSQWDLIFGLVRLESVPTPLNGEGVKKGEVREE